MTAPYRGVYFLGSFDLPPNLSGLLLPWYKQNARILPWREDPSPYRVWVSEIMLQQTRVNAVIPYFNRFMNVFPDNKALAEADEAKLLKLWEGLGYYSRARNLQKAAREVLARFNGVLPCRYEDLLSLPGVGEYTAGAISSIACGQGVPAVDGNVLRVCTRLTGCADDIALPQTKRRVRAALIETIPAECPGDFNQALMELGATVCLPNSTPLCGQCPLNKICAAHRLGLTERFPVKQPKKARRVEIRTVLVITAGDKVLLKKRADQGLLAGLYEFINLEGALPEEDLPQALADFGLTMDRLHKGRKAKHIFTHIEWHMQGFLIEVKEPAPVMGGVWADFAQLREHYAVPNAFGAFKEWVE